MNIATKLKMNKKLKIEFAPGCFDHFEGSQEELDQLIEEITRMFESGELEKNARPVDLDSEEDMELVAKALMAEQNPRNLQ